MVKVYGTSDPGIQETLRRFKLAQLSNKPLKWNLSIDYNRKKDLSIKGENMPLIGISAVMEEDGEEVDLGFIEENFADYIGSKDFRLTPIFRGGDIIIKGFRENNRVFSYEPMKVSKDEMINRPYDVIKKVNFVAIQMFTEGTEVQVEQKNFGLAFDVEIVNVKGKRVKKGKDKEIQQPTQPLRRITIKRPNKESQEANV